jgi:hypothetical protein
VPHAHHFLQRLDRVTREHTEYALNLYNDHEALKYVLGNLHTPKGAERVALTIGDDPREGPYVIVTHDGHFVTCLGKGMSTGPWPVVPRPQIDALLAKVADKRERREFAQRELRPGEEDENLFQRVISRGSRLTKEDFHALTAFEAMLGTSPYLMMIDFSLDVLEERPGASNIQKVHGGLLKAIERHDRLTWSVAHLAVLSGAGERRDLDELIELRKDVQSTPTYMCAVHMGHTFFQRAHWLAARLGKAALPTYKRALENATGNWVAMMEAANGIAAIGLRHASAFDECYRFLNSLKAAAEEKPEEFDRVGRAGFGFWAAEAMTRVDEDIENALKTGQEWCVVYGQNLPDGHPLKFTKPEDVPLDLAKTAVLHFDGDNHEDPVQNFGFHTIGLAARASAEDFYFPREYVRAWFGQWTPDETVFRLSRFKKVRDKIKHPPVRVAPTPGRNDPCPCGSGKKWKKCHGSGAPAAS